MADGVPRRPRTVKLPPPVDVHRDTVMDFVHDVLGYDRKASVVSVRLHPAYVDVVLRPRPGVTVVQRHAVIGRELDDE